MDNKHNTLNLAIQTVRFSEHIMSADKYPSIFSRQIKAIVYIDIEIICFPYPLIENQILSVYFTAVCVPFLLNNNRQRKRVHVLC